MSRYHFSRSSRETSPLMPSNNDDVSLSDLSPRPFRSPAASPSPPPSFYRSQNNRPLSSSPTLTKTSGLEFAGPPPPVTASFHTAKSQRGPDSVRSLSRPSSLSGRVAGTTIRATHPFFGLERREKAIHDELQSLLDAQSAGLLRGFGGNQGRDGSSDTGSRTPTTRSMQESVKSGIKPVRQPKKKQIGLKGARVALLRHMQELIGIKQSQDEILAVEIERREKVLRQVETWEKRIEAARAQLGNYVEAGAPNGGDEANPDENKDEVGREISELRAEERAVEHEIRELEDRLAQMKAKRSWLHQRIEESVNKREAKLSSYRGALREVETEVKGFLERPPLTVSIVELDGQSFMSLPPKRRTLSMAKELWGQEIGQLELRREEVHKETSALEEGANLWQESVDAVMKFEDDLRRQIAEPVPHEAELLTAQCDKMGQVIELLEKSAEVAEREGWNLLICAVGAELAAFQEGQDILKAALTVKTPTKFQPDKVGMSSERDTINKSGELGNPQDHRNGLSREESSEDEGPNLEELLVDHGACDERD